MSIRHQDPDLYRRSIDEERRAADAKRTLWFIAETGSRYHAALERATIQASVQAIPLSTAVLDEIQRIRLTRWHPPAGTGAHCRIEDRAKHIRQNA
jgi:hypothetical protein